MDFTVIVMVTLISVFLVTTATKGCTATENFKEASAAADAATVKYKASLSRLERQRLLTRSQLVKLGQDRLKIEASTMTRFVALASKVSRFEYKGVGEANRAFNMHIAQVSDMSEKSSPAATLLQAGLGGGGVGAVLGAGAVGVASALGAASTGTAISTLSGVAATNATLAWLGGGSLAAGGMGIVGGTAILGGIVAAPALALTAYVAEEKSEEALRKAKKYREEADAAVSRLDAAAVELKKMELRASEIGVVTGSVNAKLVKKFESIETFIAAKSEERDRLQIGKDKNESDYEKKSAFIKLWHLISFTKPDFSYRDPLGYENFSVDEKAEFSKSMVLGYELYSLLNVPILDEKGVLTKESDDALEAGKHALATY